ncbi:MAG: AAA family ATPase [Firmicutes bacterium]|nr:AAA family ATPase [Bacillota bacterium]
MKKSRQQEIEELQERVFGKGAPARNVPTSMNEMMEEARKAQAHLDQVEKTNAYLNDILIQQMKEIEEMNAGISKQLNTTPPPFLDVEEIKVPVKESAPSVNVDALEDVLNKSIIGQEQATKALVKAIKRPLVLENEGSESLNSILVLGPKGSGKHEMIQEMAGHMACPIVSIDLSKYSTQEDESLFLQDVYAALSQARSILLFENPETCFTGYLSMVAKFFKTGRIPLKKRYKENKGQLQEINSNLVKDAIDALSARDHYLILVTDLKKNKVVDLLGIEFMNSLTDIIETKPLDDYKEAWIQKEQEELKVKGNKLFTLALDKSVAAFYETKYIPSLGIHSLDDCTNAILQALSQYKLENSDVQNIRIYFDEKLMIEAGGETKDLFSMIAKVESVDLDSIKKELEEIVGLQEVKKYVLSLENTYKIQRLREKQGLKTASISKHMIFTGNPGTGKTTIARLISQYLRAIGILSGGQLIEVTRADLVGRYVGHTAPLTMQVVQSALGGVLFIDEAYSLYRGKEDSFGLEAIDTIVKAIEDYRDNLIVILAGYKKEMNDFLESNSGLKSRFPNIIDFKDYTAEELVQISLSIAKSKDYYISDECLEPLKEYFDQIQMDDSKMSGNGRLARNKVEEAIRNQSSRLVEEENPNLQELKLSDFQLDGSSFVQ